ncbi:MAG TPA: DUF4386 family protein [Dehalococcoidia bacterium]|nr:DUF4386 family protein [Dehalococcoidia bacterium]
MFSGDRIFPVAGCALLLLIVALIVNVVCSASFSDKSPFERDEVEEYLTDLNDNETEVIGAAASSIIVDSFVGPLAGIAGYLLFRQRQRLLATTFLGFLLVGAAVSLVADAVGIGNLIIAKDFADGGPAGIAAGDSTITEVGRALGMTQFALTQAGFSAISVAILALGALISFAPERGVVPPRWIGWLLVLSGVSGLLGWIVVVADFGFVFFIIAGLSQLIGLASLGVWLLRSRDKEVAMMAGAAAPA